jgi:hypothetical protein
MYNNPLRRRPMTGRPPSWGQSPGQGFDPTRSYWPGEIPGGGVGPIPGAPPLPSPAPGMPGTPWFGGPPPSVGGIAPPIGTSPPGTGIAPASSSPGVGQPSDFGTGVADNFAALGSAPSPVSSIGVPTSSPFGNVAPGVPPYGSGTATPMQRHGWQGAGGPFGMRPGGQNWGIPNFASRFRGLI